VASGGRPESVIYALTMVGETNDGRLFIDS